MLNMTNKKMVWNIGGTYYYRWVAGRYDLSCAWLLYVYGYFGYNDLDRRFRAVAVQLLSF
jgi:hypothetical protein